VAAARHAAGPSAVSLLGGNETMGSKGTEGGEFTRSVLVGLGEGVQQWATLLTARGFVVKARHTIEELQDLDRSQPLDAVILNAQRGAAAEVIARLARWRQAHRSLHMVLVSESSEALLLAALRAGIADYLCQPVARSELLAAIERMRASLGHRQPPRTDAPAWSSVEAMIGESQAIREVRASVQRVARTDSTVLITGETGVGKELVAQMIHRTSLRAHRPCVSINCAAIPDTLLESELFGVERGAFTGADRGREGTLKAAEGGSVFFDEIGDMGLAGQAKILRVIDAREVQRLGGTRTVPLNVRVIAATNQDLESLVRQGRFRKDLFYRLNVVRMTLPPLRERLDDLGPLIDFFIVGLNQQFGREVRGLTSNALEHLRRHDWPGNVRELKNVIEAVFVNLDGSRIDFADLPEALRAPLAQDPRTSERERLVAALFATDWNKSKAAEELHWSRMTLYRKLAKYHVVRDEAPTRKRS
jgi:DNA-binding NtrC family response regulator